MYDTYNSISKINTKELEDLDLNDITIRFNKSKDPNERNKCFAHVFKKIYPMLLKIHHDPKFSSISCEEKTEECLNCTLFAMEHWKPERKQKISSFVYMVLTSALKTNMHRSQNSYKHKVFNNLISDPEISEFVLKSIPYNSSEKLKHFLDDLNDSSILNHDEIMYCKYLLKGFKTNKQVAEQMNIREIPKFDKKSKKYITLPVTSEFDKLKYCSSLRQSIKKKLRENNYDFFK